MQAWESMQFRQELELNQGLSIYIYMCYIFDFCKMPCWFVCREKLESIHGFIFNNARITLCYLCIAMCADGSVDRPITLLFLKSLLRHVQVIQWR